MGCCGSLSNDEIEKRKKQSDMNKQIELKQQNDLDKDEQIKKLLLLGAGESGKSTLFKQMITLYGRGYTEDDRVTYKSIIEQNTLSAITKLIKYCNILNEEYNTKLNDENILIAQELLSTQISTKITQNLANKILKLWNDDGIKLTYEYRAKFQFPDSGAYFIEKVNETYKNDYIPNDDDLFRTRVRTTGIVETSFDIDGNHFKMFDVGGQRNERKKWIHCFEGVTCVIFVAAISEYDQQLFEDESINRVNEALDLFDKTCNSKWFKHTAMILFLNKRDLFLEKIQKVSLKEYFPIYNGPENDYDAGCEFFRELFESKNRYNKEIYTHVTCATDTDNISHVFYAVKDIIVKQSLRDGGLL